VSQYHNLQFNHHRAGEDAKICAMITLKAFEEMEHNDLVEALKLLGVKLKKL
jgi:DNA polymerase-3 subunit epsilon